MQELALVDAISRLEDASDGESGNNWLLLPNNLTYEVSPGRLRHILRVAIVDIASSVKLVRVKVYTVRFGSPQVHFSLLSSSFFNFFHFCLSMYIVFQSSILVAPLFVKYFVRLDWMTNKNIIVQWCPWGANFYGYNVSGSRLSQSAIFNSLYFPFIFTTDEKGL